MKRIVRRLGRRRLPADELARHDAFIDELDRPEDALGRRTWLEARSQLIHLGVRLFGGGPTFAQVSVAAAITAIGSALLTIAPPPNETTWGVSTPEWIQALITIGLFGLAFDAARAPRRLRATSFMRYAALPLAVALVLTVATFAVVLWPDWIIRVAFAVAAVGFLSIAAGAVSRRSDLLRSGFVLVGVGAAGASFADGIWCVLYAFDGDELLAVGCALASLGTALIAFGLVRVRPIIASATP